jgi:hypothetical protein
MESCDKIKDARTHLRHAAQAMEERVLGHDVASHLRQAARSMLQAGLAAIDERDQRTHETPAKPAASTTPTTTH